VAWIDYLAQSDCGNWHWILTDTGYYGVGRLSSGGANLGGMEDPRMISSSAIGETRVIKVDIVGLQQRLSFDVA